MDVTAALDDVARLALVACRAEIAVVAVVDPAAERLLARAGTDVERLPRDVSLAALALAGGGARIETDLSRVPDLAVNPLLSGRDPRAYAGVPVPDAPDTALYVLGDARRGFDAADADALATLARLAGAALAWAADFGASDAAEARLGAIMDAMAEGVVLVDADGRVALANAAAQRMLGTPRGALVGRDYDELPWSVSRLDGTALPQPDVYVSRALARSAVSRGEEVLLSGRGGRVRAVSLSATPFHDRVGAVSGVVVAFTDITRRREAERRQAESERLFRTAFAHAAVGMTLASLDGRYLEANAAFCDIVGRPPEDLPELAHADVIHPEDHATSLALLDRLLADEIPAFTATTRYVQPSGEIVWGEDSVSLVRDDEGRPLRLISLTKNITIRKEAQEALQRRNEELAASLAELDATTRELARSNADLAQFAYVASHDLQEPLRMIASYVQLLGRRYRGKLDADADEFIAFATDGAERMQALINDLLDYARVDASPREFARTDTEAALARALANLRTAVEESGAVVTYDPLPDLHADPAQLAQLFQNLVGNAIKFRADLPPRIHVSADRSGDEVVVRVRDNGIGIDPRFHERIFSIFQRLHGRDRYPGTGIGLAVCKRVAERHGGRIWVESEPGGGSTFCFTIPAPGGQ